MDELARVHRAEEIAAEAVRQDEARVLLRHARGLQLVIDPEQRPDGRIKGRRLRRVGKFRRDIARAGKIDVAAGFDREGRQPEFDQELLGEDGDVLEG